MDGTAITTYTNEFGNFRLTNVPVGDVTVRTNYTGLDEAVSTVAVTPRQVSVLNVEMTSESRALP